MSNTQRNVYSSLLVLVTLLLPCGELVAAQDVLLRLGDGFVIQYYHTWDEESASKYDYWTPPFLPVDAAIAYQPMYFLDFEFEFQCRSVFGTFNRGCSPAITGFVGSSFLRREHFMVRPLARVGVGYGSVGFYGDQDSIWKAVSLIGGLGTTGRLGDHFNWVFEVRCSYDFRIESTQHGYEYSVDSSGRRLPAITLETHIGFEFSFGSIIKLSNRAR